MTQKKEAIVYIDVGLKNDIPVKVIQERRNGLRASIGKESLIFRHPPLTSSRQERAHWRWFMAWAKKIALKHEGQQLAHLIHLPYTHGTKIVVGQRSYVIHLTSAERKTVGATLNHGIIHIKLPKNMDSPLKNKAIKAALSRVISADYLPYITTRVDALNEAHFKRPIGKVKLKYNYSNWGSCSRRGNINLSSRLLFAPSQVIDYVIIHELAHLAEFNHSPRFWFLVEKAMPNYVEAETWLRSNYHLCDF
ncbi:MAG: M48 family metallopeptidase [Saprospiraceae bacterium]|nr:M48 family metallopeptidase [Saprospiraceae bacterium]